MIRSLLVFFLLSALHAGSLFAQNSYSYAKAKIGRNQSQSSLKSVRLYNDREGQVLFIRRIKSAKEQESYGIFDDPGGLIHFFPTQDPSFATISLGQSEAEVNLISEAEDPSRTWQMSLPGDTVYFQQTTLAESDLPSTETSFRLYKKVRPHSAILAVPEGIEVDLLRFELNRETVSTIWIESETSLEDYSELFPIMCTMIIFRHHIGT